MYLNVVFVCLLGTLMWSCAPERIEYQRLDSEVYKAFAERSVTQFGLKRGEVVFTFDDGPTRHTDVILDTLKAENIPATFFVVGRLVSARPATMQRIVNEGHILGNHTYHHRSSYNSSTLYSDMNRAQDLLDPYIEASMQERIYFRSPYGIWNAWRADRLNAHPRLRRIIGNIFWNVGGHVSFSNGQMVTAADWECWSRGYSVETCAEGYYTELVRKGGGVILFHDVTAKTARMIPLLLDKMAKGGQDGRGNGVWTVKTLDELDALDYLEEDKFFAGPADKDFESHN